MLTNSADKIEYKYYKIYKYLECFYPIFQNVSALCLTLKSNERNSCINQTFLILGHTALESSSNNEECTFWWQSQLIMIVDHSLALKLPKPFEDRDTVTINVSINLSTNILLEDECQIYDFSRTPKEGR